MALNKTIVLSGVAAGIVVVASAVGGAIFAANMSSNNSVSTTSVEEKAKSNGWQEKNGSWYYYKDDVAQTGWIKDQGNWYYLNSDGTMATNTKIDGYYLNEKGIMVNNLSETSQLDNKNTTLSYKDAIVKAINYEIGSYSYITSVKFEEGVESYGEDTFNLLIPKQADDSSKYVLFSNRPFKDVNPAVPEGKDIVAYANLRSDGVYEVRGQFLTSFSGKAEGGSFISRTSGSIYNKDDSSILVYPDGRVAADGFVCKDLFENQLKTINKNSQQKESKSIVNGQDSGIYTRYNATWQENEWIQSRIGQMENNISKEAFVKISGCTYDEINTPEKFDAKVREYFSQVEQLYRKSYRYVKELVDSGKIKQGQIHGMIGVDGWIDYNNNGEEDEGERGFR
ncbi:MAG: hypothetical protein E6Z86_02760 [Clostridium butyricum]|nr:hypothetical protein [Clostridium butyricum]MDU5818867.1 hypothetical protein [Clostridium butyricum]